MRNLYGFRDKKKLDLVSTTHFVGNKNEIRYYYEPETGRNFAEACFNYSENTKLFMSTKWFLLSKADIKDDDAYRKTEEKINNYFGYFGEKRNEAL